jgi:DNA primase
LSCGYSGNLYHLFGEPLDKLGILRERLKRTIEEIRASSIGLKMPEDAEYLSNAYRVSLSTLNEFEAFRSLSDDHVNRIVFPIKDLKGKINCFVGRSEDPFDKVKYKISPAGSSTPLFPLNKVIPCQGRVMLVEGLFDMLNLYDNGFENVLCAFGTRKVTKDKLKLLKVMGVTGIDICFDPDNPGQEAAEVIKEMAEELFLTARNINLRDVDPGDLQPLRASKLREKLYG